MRTAAVMQHEMCICAHVRGYNCHPNNSSEQSTNLERTKGSNCAMNKPDTGVTLHFSDRNWHFAEPTGLVYLDMHQLKQNSLHQSMKPHFLPSTFCQISQINECAFTFTLRKKRASTAQQIPLCLTQKPTESGSLHSSKHCCGSCAVCACNASILHEHARNHARFMFH